MRTLSILALCTTGLIGAGVNFVPGRAPTPLVDPDAILEIQATALTTYLPSSASPIQDVRPRVGQRGVQIDGALKAGTFQGLAIAGNPFATSSGTSSRFGNVRLDVGTYEVNDVDLRLPSTGFDWTIGRTYNARQLASDDSTHRDSTGYQGKNWFQMSNPELVFYDADGSEESTDFVYLVYGADRYIEFKRVAANSQVFRATDGAAGVLFRTKDTTASDGVPGKYVYTDQTGNEVYFFDEDADAGSNKGQLWKIVDPAGNVAYFGHATTIASAMSSGYSSGLPIQAFDATGRRYTYSYDGSNRLTSVVAEVNSGGWTAVGTVEYAYYTHDNDTDGNNGDLKLVTITTPLTDSGINLVQKKYYRYYDFDAGHTSYNASTNPGYPHLLKLIVGYEGCRKYDYASDSDLTDNDFYAETTTNLKPYAEAYFEYDTSQRVMDVLANGQCGCGDGGDGTFEFEYEPNGSYSNNTAGYDEDEPLSRTVVRRPDATYVTQYFDEVYQPLSQVITDADPDNTGPAPSFWATYVDRNSKGVLTEVSTPSNVSAYTHSSASFTRSSSVGLVFGYVLVGSSNTTEGFCSDRLFKEAGTGGSAYYDHSWTYTFVSYQVDGGETKSTVARPVIATEAEYSEQITSGSSGKRTWTYTNAAHGASGRDLIVLKVVDTAAPAVTTANNGSNSATTTSRYWNKDGTLGFEKSALGYITYHGYTNGQQTTLISDADTAHGDFSGITVPTTPTDFTSTGTELHHKATYAYDAQGRLDTSTADSYTPKMYYSRLKDHRVVTLGFTNKVSTTYYGPVSYSVQNQAGKSEVSGVIGLSSNSTTAALTALIDETDDDPITAVDTGTVRRMTTNHYTSSGTQLSETRAYFAIPASEPGTDGTHFDPTKFAYDDTGRIIRTKEACGTIRRSVYDALGRTTQRWIGTNDYGSTGGEGSGPANIVKTEALVYDGGSDKGNSYVTTRTLYVEDSTTDQRVTTYTNDARGRAILEARPTTPHYLHKYDNLGRRIATGLYSDTSGLSVTSDPTATSASNRRALSETKFDERGQVWETVHQKINQSTGAKEDTLLSDNWYDADRRLVKVDGHELAKYFYDRLDRQTHRFTLVNTNDSVYGDADDVSGDVVMEEEQTTYDSSDGKVIMSALIQRNHDDVGGGATTGALDTNADSDRLKYTDTNVEGRIQITAYWNGLQGVTDEVQYGSYAGATFDRTGLSAPSRSTTALRTSYVYNEDNTLLSVQDPTIAASRVTKYEYDALGRRTKEIRHYDSGVASGAPSGTDDNVTTAWAYTDGLMTSLTADVPAGQTDQVTTYTYGTTKGASAGDSKIATGHLLQKVTYPDSSDSGDVVKMAYNAQQQEIWHKDQEPSGSTASIIETDYDTVGRQTARRVTTLGTNFDGAVRRIATTYTNLGQTSLATQYDAASSGNIVNEVRFTYDGWGNVLTYEEDRDSAVDAGGSVNDYGVTYVYAKNTGGRNALRRTSAALNVGTAGAVKTITYTYTSNYDDDLSRVSQVKVGASILAEYEYLGVGFVVGDNRPNPATFSKQHSLVSAGAYDDLDRFSRRTIDKWAKDLASDVNYWRTDVTWDENSNPTVAEDQVHVGFDVAYTLDDLDRVTRAKEGTWNGSSITSQSRDQQWDLTHTGNWSTDKLNLNGDADFTDTNEHDDTRTHNAVNEILTQTVASGTLVHDPAGNLTDDKQSYEYEYDAFYRLRKIKNQSSVLVEELTYNGLGHLVGEHADTDTDGDVDGSDKWYYTAYDEWWRGVATYRESDSDPKEIFVLQQAGGDGLGGSSYINGVILRQKDATTAWTSASDGTLEQAYYYYQNWRGDVVALTDHLGKTVEWAKYSAYGVPFGLPKGDADSDGDCDSTDANTVIQGWIATSSFDTRGDLDLDGDVDATDKSAALSASSSIGFGAMSCVGNRRGVAGYTAITVSPTIALARARVLGCRLGRWSRRDPVAATRPSLYEYVKSKALVFVDPRGQDDEPPPGLPPPPPPPKTEMRDGIKIVVDTPGKPGECKAGMSIDFAYAGYLDVSRPDAPPEFRFTVFDGACPNVNCYYGVHLEHVVCPGSVGREHFAVSPSFKTRDGNKLDGGTDRAGTFEYDLSFELPCGGHAKYEFFCNAQQSLIISLSCGPCDGGPIPSRDVGRATSAASFSVAKWQGRASSHGIMVDSQSRSGGVNRGENSPVLGSGSECLGCQ